MQTFDFAMPTRVLFGPGRIHELGRNLAEGLDRVIIVTDPGVAAVSGALDSVIEQLGDRDVTVFAEVEPNPSLTTVGRVGTLARQVAAKTVIGLGGGSPMDVAKGAAVLAANPGRLSDVLAAGPPGGCSLPVVCIPTTSGTGSEVTPYAVFTDTEAHVKVGHSSPALFPTLAIVDPELTYSMPANVAVDTGLDALTHAIEAYVSLEASTVSDLFALRTIEIVRDRLPEAIRRDRTAMDAVSLAATLAGVAISLAGTTLLHVMGYPLTVFHDVPHGRASACMLPQYLLFLGSQDLPSAKVGRLQQLFAGVGGAAAFLHALGVSTRLGDYGVDANEIDGFVEAVLVKDDLAITPAKVGRSELTELYSSALDG